ncbi:MAG: hypothetical protein KIT87_29430, partial [Anaerolineae bacterium]|nr:hypothetical protein [Anaerolineae bacterium]
QPVPHVRWGTHRAATLCKVLLTYSGQRLHKEQVQDWLWPQASVEAAARNLRVALSELRSVLEPERQPRAPSRFIQNGGESLSLGGDGVEIDSQMVLDAAELDPQAPHALKCLQAAVQVYRGPYLPDDLYEDWAQTERQRLLLAHESVQLKLAQAYAHHRQYPEAIQTCRQALVTYPTHEGFVEHLIYYTAQTGQPALALAAYDRLAEVLAADLGASPSPHLASLARQARDGTLESPAPLAVETMVNPGLSRRSNQTMTLTMEGHQLQTNLHRSEQLVGDLITALEEIRLKRVRLQMHALQAETVRARLASI